MNYAVDRDEINELGLPGHQRTDLGRLDPSSKLFNRSSKNYYKYNIKKAKKLLKEAGVENLTFDFYAGPTPETRAHRDDPQGADGPRPGSP